MTARTVLRRVHSVAGALGFAIILLFWTSTVTVEMLGSTADIAAVKRTIAWSLIVLVPALAITGMTGFRLGGKSSNRHVVAKKRRMPFIAGIGLMILVPAALYLAAASDGELGTGFYVVQGVELLAGGTNVVLMGLNIRDGLRVTARRRASLRRASRRPSASVGR